jgi:hypothetical protein
MSRRDDAGISAPAHAVAPDRLSGALHGAAIPGEPAARARVRATVLSAYAATPRRRRSRVAGTATALVLLLAGAGALTRPGQAVGEWLGHRIEAADRPARAPRPHATPASRRDTLPAAGRVLVAGDHGLWIVDRDGAKRGLGDWTDGAWSPHALNVAVARGRTLAAVTAEGAIRWRHVAPTRVADPRWSPDGLNIAYRAGSRMRLIYGNGEHDLALPGRAAPAAPAWRPSDPNTLAWARADGTVLVENAFTGLVVWRHRGGPVRRLAWSADGRRLLIAGDRHGAVFALATGTAAVIRLQRGERITAAAFSPRGEKLALALRGNGVSAVRLGGARASLVETPHAIRTLTWSPDGRWLLAPAGSDWLLARVGASPAVQALAARTTALAWS